MPDVAAILSGIRTMIDKKAPVSTLRPRVLALCLAVLAAPALAQTASVPTPQEVDQAFRDVLANVGSVDAHSKYATLLVRSGNYEGGIAALEGLLLGADAPSSIRLELGVLYYRLGSYAASESYLRAALADPRLDTGQAAQAQSLLRVVEQRNRSSQLSGSVMLGLRGQSNPTGASNNDLVYYQGVAVPRAKDGGAKSDTDTQIWGKLDHVLDLDKQNEASVVTSLVVFANHYNSVSNYSVQPGSTKPFDIAILAGSTGLRFKPSPSGTPGLRVRPHLLFGSASANGSGYFTVGGLGIDGDYRSSETLVWGGTLESSRLAFSSRDDIANAALQGGNRQILRLSATVETTINQFLVVELGYADHDGNAAYTGFRGPQARLSYVVSYASPLSATGLPWTTTVSGSGQGRDYRGADPTVDARTTRKDTEWRWSLVQSIPLARSLDLQVQMEYTNNASNLPNYSYTNSSGTLSVVWKY